MSRKRFVSQISADDCGVPTYPTRKRVRRSAVVNKSQHSDSSSRSPLSPPPSQPLLPTVAHTSKITARSFALPNSASKKTKALKRALGDRHVQQSRASDLQRIIRAAAQKTFDKLGAGLTENVYRDALAVELQHKRVRVWSDREVILPIHHRNRYVGYCRSDIVLLCSDSLGSEQNDADGRDGSSSDSGGGSSSTDSASESEIVGERILRNAIPRSSVRPNERPIVIELKAVASGLNSCNVQQLCAYMRLLHAQQGVLINFVQGDPVIQSSLVNLRTLLSWSASTIKRDACLCLPKRAPKQPIQTVFVNLVQNRALEMFDEIEEIDEDD